MIEERFTFGRFVLDAPGRALLRDGEPIDCSNRYLDALLLMVGRPGELVTKDRFMEEVWRGVPVTDEALTQCIRTLRRLLGDDAARPSYIATVPKHGYRFIAPVSHGPAGPSRETAGDRSADTVASWRELLEIGIAGTIGGAAAGLIGGLAYGFDATAQPLQPGVGAISVVLVLAAVTMLVATLGAAGVAFGIAAARVGLPRSPAATIVGGALGGLVVGALAKLLGLDAFDLLFGRSPGDITGGAEGLLLGGAVGLGCWLAFWRPAALSWRRAGVLAAAVGGAAGMAIPLLGGRMMGGSLALLAGQFPGSRLEFGQLGRFFGESDFGIVSRTVTGGLEGALFAACIVGAIALAQSRFSAAGASFLRQT